MLRTNTKPHQPINPAKICCSKASLVFCKFSYRTYQNGIKRVLQIRGTPNTSKRTNRVSSIPFVENPHFSIPLTGCSPSKIYLCLEDNSLSFSRVSLKSETKDSHP